MSMPAPEDMPSPIRTDGTNDFAAFTMRMRQPNMIQKVLDANPDYPDFIRADLIALKQALQNQGDIPLLNLHPAPTPDYVEWASSYLERRAVYNPNGSLNWGGVDWFFAETYMFRLMIEAVRWWELGSDPFRSMKREELASPTLWQMLDAALSLEGGVIDRLPELLTLATFGNRIDLSYATSMAHGTDMDDDDLIVDDREAVRDHLLRAQLQHFPEDSQGIAHIVLDNFGTELAMDLALTDALLSGYSDVVVLHTKYHPTFVSDATASDVRWFIRHAATGDHGGETYESITAMALRLREALGEGRLRLAPNLFWTSSRPLWQMPQVLQHPLQDAQIVILKGDANYRRAVGDAVWNTTTPFSEVVGYFPVPLLALRTLKSDPIVGLPEGMSYTLSESDNDWRTNGKRGVVQLHVPPRQRKPNS